MNPLIDVQILRVFLGETAHYNGLPVYESIVNEARKRGVAGASVTRGFMGFGANSLLHTAKILRLSEDLPVIVEIVDTPSRIADFLPIVEAMVDEGTIMVEEAKAIFHLPMRIRDVMSAEVATATPDMPLSGVVELLLRRKIKALPVLDNKRIIGIITGGDLLERAGMPLRLEVQCQLPPELRDENVRCVDKEGLTARDVMSSPVEVLNIKTKVSDALALMAKRQLKRLPVVDDSGNLMGIVSRVDVLRAIAKAATLTITLPELPKSLKKTAEDVTFREVPTASPDTPLSAVLEKIIASPLKRVVVVDGEGKTLGIIHDSDLVARYAEQEKRGVLRSLLASLSSTHGTPTALEGTARDVMKTEVFTILPDTPLAVVINHFVEKKAKRLVVADADGRLLGLIDRETVMRVLAGS